MDDRLRHLADLLRQWRRGRGIKATVAARELGVSKSTWGHWEKGRRFPGAENLVALSAYTEIEIQHFFCPNRNRCPYRDENGIEP